MVESPKGEMDKKTYKKNEISVYTLHIIIIIITNSIYI